MEAVFNFPRSGTFKPDVETTSLATELSKELTELVRQKAEQAKLPDPLGVALFKMNPKGGTLEFWTPGDKDRNGAMVNAYKAVDCSALLDRARAYCLMMVAGSNIQTYLKDKSAALGDYNVIVHLHYYRSRPKPDAFLHKDTRGQTLFFMLHYLSALPIYGAEWMWDQGLAKESGPRRGPADIEGVWPLTICADVLKEKRDGPADDNLHVFRVDPYGAVLVVDDVVHHRTPNPNPRAEWGHMPNFPNYSQASYVQAADATGQNGYYEIQRGRSAEREPDAKQERSRSMSNERSKKENGADPENRWDNTFDKVRQFFRIWVTVSPISVGVVY